MGKSLREPETDLVLSAVDVRDCVRRELKEWKEKVRTTQQRQIRDRGSFRHRFRSHHGLKKEETGVSQRRSGRKLQLGCRLERYILVPGAESLGLVAPRRVRPFLTASLPSQTMQTTGPATCKIPERYKCQPSTSVSHRCEKSTSRE